jgi:hypothetical protein
VTLSIERQDGGSFHLQTIVGEGAQAITNDNDVRPDGGSPLANPIAIQLGSIGASSGRLCYDNVLVQAF